MINRFKNDRMFWFLIILTICSTAGLQVWRTLFDNFAVHVAGITGEQLGVIQSVREIPGFLALLAVYVLLVLKEYRLSALSVAILGVGVAIAGYFPTYYGLIFTTLVMSFGFHYFETTNQSLTLQYFDIKTAPIVFGWQRRMGAAANIAIGIIIFAIAPFFEYRTIFLVFGVLIFIVGLYMFSWTPTRDNLPPQRKRMILRRRYSLFYFLTFMAGARRQIFIAFAVFLLVKRLGFTVQDIAVLFLVNNTINYMISPAIGKAIVRYGERWMLSLEYFSLFFIFLGYSFVTTWWGGAALYILDHVFFNFAIAINSYFQKVGDPKDIAPSMAVGFTINHIAAVVLPVLGGLLWMADYRIPFWGGAGMCIISLIAVQWIRTPDAGA